MAAALTIALLFPPWDCARPAGQSVLHAYDSFPQSQQGNRLLGNLSLVKIVP